MTLYLPKVIVSRLVNALSSAGKREIGGVLMGEHIGVDTFRVLELTTQMQGGTFASFVRFVEQIVNPLRQFFGAVGHDYTRFNYLGEWHSHHSFELVPSSRDSGTMWELFNDDSLGANFAALLLVRLGPENTLEHSVTVYRAGLPPRIGIVIVEP